MLNFFQLTLAYLIYWYHPEFSLQSYNFFLENEIFGHEHMAEHKR